MIQNHKKILLVGGGTGGHVTPLIAIIEEFLAAGIPPSSIFLATDKESAKLDYVQGHQIEVHTIVSGKFHRFLSLSNFITPFKVIWGFLQSLGLLRKIKPDVILAKGAYLSAPLVYAASKLHIPIYLHESDSIMGATNRRLAKYTQKIFVSFPINYYPEEIRNKLIFSGLPIRRRFFSTTHRHLHIGGVSANVGDSNLKKIMAWGGSQGAERINEMIAEKLTDYLKNYELYHICGEKNFAYGENAKKNLPIELQNKYHLYAFLGREIEKIVAGCDLVISRAGATSLFELAALGKAVITIPYPYAAADHQTKNAQYFGKNNSVIVLKEDEIDAQILKKSVDDLMQDSSKKEELSENIKKLAPKEAGKIIVEYLIK